MMVSRYEERFSLCSVASRWRLLAAACLIVLTVPSAAASEQNRPATGILRAGFLVVPGVFNSELMAPYDVLQHSVFRDEKNYIEPFIVSPDGKALRTFEGIEVVPHYSFENCPAIDILIIPSTETSMTKDLENAAYMAFVRRTIESAKYVITVCDGAFPLAATGVLDGRSATTFPGDQTQFAETFPAIDVRTDVRFVADGKFITSVGGAMSYEPALYLVETLYSKDHAERTAKGLVWPWKLDDVPHLVK